MELSGRYSARAQVLEAVRLGRAVVVVGPAGSGRTRCAEDVMATLEQEARETHLIRGADAVAAFPLAPVAPLLAEVRLEGLDPLGVYTRLPAALRQRRAVLVVDDVGELDRATSVLLGQVIRAEVPVVLTCTAAEEIPRAVRDEMAARQGVTVRLEPLSIDDVLALAASVAGDELASASSARIIGLGERNPALVVDVMTASTLAAGPRGVELAIERPGERSREVVRSRLATLDEAAIDALRDICVSAGLPEAQISQAALNPLRASGHVIAADGLVVAARPLDAVVLVADLPASELAHRQRVLGHALAALPLWESRSTLLLLRGSGTVDASAIVRAAEAFLLHGDADRAAEIAEHLEAENDPEVALLRGRIASTRGDLDDAACRFAEVEEQGNLDDAICRQLGQELGLLHAVRRMDPATAVTEVSRLLVQLTDPEARRILDADLVKWRLMAGQGSATLAADSSATARARLTEAVITAMIASMDGTAEQVERAVADGRDQLAELTDVEPWVADLLSLSDYLGRAFAGDVLAAEAMATSRRDEAARLASPALGMWEYAAAETALHRGESRRMETLARRAVRHLAWRDYTGLQPTAAALVAVAHARAGRLTQASQVVEAIPEPQRLDPKVALHVARVEAELLLRAGDQAGAADVLERAAIVAAEQMHRQLAVMALDEAMMVHPTTARLSRLVDLAQVGARGSLGDDLSERAAALLDGSVESLLAWPDRFLAIGFVGRASHAAAVIARRLAGGGCADEARVWRQRAVLLGSDGGAARWPVVDGVRALTPRELDVARLAATRARSREIAERLGLSVRTVDNHLARVYRKLGVTGRDDLREALVLEGELVPSPV